MGVELVCSNCEAVYDVRNWWQRCPACDEPLEVRCDRAWLEQLHMTPGTQGWPVGRLLPPGGYGPRGFREPYYLGEGRTPLLRLHGLGRQLGLRCLYAKVEGANPTGSFKDRGSAAGIRRALGLGAKAVGTVSTGNMAGSVAAFARTIAQEAVVLVPASIPGGKLRAIGVYGPRIVAVDGPYEELYTLSLELGRELGIYFINSDDPYRVEGQKTLALEIYWQLGSRAPDYVILPISSGGNYAALVKGFRELRETGHIEREPGFIAVQAAGCAPIAHAAAQQERRVTRWPMVSTSAKAIANPGPPSGNRALRLADGRTDYHFLTATDDEISEAYKELGRVWGVSCQFDSAIALAGLRRACRDGLLPDDAEVVVVLTGHGSKDSEAMERLDVSVEQASRALLLDVLAKGRGSRRDSAAPR